MIVTVFGVVGADERVQVGVVGLRVCRDQRGLAVARGASRRRPEPGEQPDRGHGRGADHREAAFASCGTVATVPSSSCVWLEGRLRRSGRSAGASSGPPLPSCPRRPRSVRGRAYADPRIGRITGSAIDRLLASRPMSESARLPARALRTSRRGRVRRSSRAEDLPYYSDWHGSFEKLPWATDDAVAPRGERRRRDRRARRSTRACRHARAPGSVRGRSGWRRRRGARPTRGRSSCSTEPYAKPDGRRCGRRARRADTLRARAPRDPREGLPRRRAPGRSRSCSAATIRSPIRAPPRSRARCGRGRVGVIHFDAHADTGADQWGNLHAHGQPMRRLIEGGLGRRQELRADRSARLLARQGDLRVDAGTRACVGTR